MPWLDNSNPGDPSAQQWRIVLKNALLRRLPAAQFPLEELACRYPAPSSRIAQALVGLRTSGNGFDDPLWFQYAQTLLLSEHIVAADLLVILLESSQFSEKLATTRPVKSRSGLPTCEERIFTILAILYSSSTLEIKHQSVHQLIYALTRWLHAIHEYETAKQLEFTGLHTLDAFSFGMYEALANLVLIVFRSNCIRTVAQQPWWKLRRPAVVLEMENFDIHILQWMRSQLSRQLQALAKTPPFIGTDADGRPILTSQDVLESVTEIPSVRSRAGLYIWLNACLCARPLTDDKYMLGYLQARYTTDYQSMAVDLLIASFDVLTNAMVRREPRQSVKVIRSFVCNKLPLVLAVLAGFIAASGMTLESCIQMAFMSSITEDILPPITAGASDVREVLKRTKLEFLQACALHQLVSEETIAQILREPSIALPRVIKYTRDGLVAQCNSNVGRLEGLIDELQGLQGNAGAVAGCVVQVIANLCMSKDTMSLKTVCHMLIKRIPDMDIVMQYAQPSSLLFPLCQLLNDWVHDQDQTEFTPSYEEFAAILLFTLAIMHQYDVDVAEVGLSEPDTFISRLAKYSATSRPLSDLSAEQGAQLGKWLEGLYTTDEHGETSGISDDVMRQCPPQDFYLLVPTLFEQSVAACRSGSLQMGTLKGGLELLLEPFLLPSLVCGLGWLSKHSWEDHGDADILLQVLDKLLKPLSSSQEVQAMHRAVLAMVSSPLLRSLQDLLRRHPEKKEAGALVALLKPHEGQQRMSRFSTKAMLAEWSSAKGAMVVQALRNDIQRLIVWSSNIEANPPPKYSHATIVPATNVLGPERVLRAFVAEIKETAANDRAFALDVCVSMICAPTSSAQASAVTGVAFSRSNQITLRDCLNIWMSDTQKLLDMPASEAEATIRLSRGVEAQCAASHIPQAPPTLTAQDSAEQVLQDLGLTDAAVSGAVTGDQSIALGPSATTGFTDAELSSALGHSVDLTDASAPGLDKLASTSGAMQLDQDQSFFGDLDLGMGMGQHAQQAHGLDAIGDEMLIGANNGPSNQEEDIFAGLDMGNMSDDFDFP